LAAKTKRVRVEEKRVLRRGSDDKFIFEVETGGGSG
jgi:hypothetical protein